MYSATGYVGGVNDSVEAMQSTALGVVVVWVTLTGHQPADMVYNNPARHRIAMVVQDNPTRQ